MTTSNSPTPDATGGTAPPLQDPQTLAAVKKRSLILLAILLPAIALTIQLVISERRPFRPPETAEKAVPHMIRDGDRIWTSDALSFSDVQMQILETRDYLFRRYDDGQNKPVELCVVFSEDNRKGTHPPDVCLEAGGCSIVERSDRVIMLDGQPLTIRELITTTVGANDQYTYFAYFYKCGDTFTPSFYRQQVQIVWNGLTHQNTAGALIRYSTPMKKTELAQARARTDEFIAATFPYLKKNLNADR
jgi:EpsI family protein